MNEQLKTTQMMNKIFDNPEVEVIMTFDLKTFASLKE